MKNRSGFVSNSSSTSFCIIGVNVWDRDKAVEREKEEIVAVLVELEDIDVDDDCSFRFGVESRENISFFGSEGEIYYVGVDAKPLLQTMSIPDARALFTQKMHALYNLCVPLEYVEFLYGESGSG